MAQVVAAARPRAGFTLQEVIVVIAIGLIVTAVALPVMSNAIANMKLRSSMTSVSGLLQNLRTVAVQQNKTKTACHYNNSTPPYSLIYFVKDGMTCAETTRPATSDPQVELEAPITAYAQPSDSGLAGAPAVIDLVTLGNLTSNPETTDPSFNSRGIPCLFVSASSCDAPKAFIQYYKDNRISGSGGWAAISISPAGRIKRWFWTGGSTWVN